MESRGKVNRILLLARQRYLVLSGVPAVPRKKVKFFIVYLESLFGQDAWILTSLFSGVLTEMDLNSVSSIKTQVSTGPILSKFGPIEHTYAES